MDYQLPAETYDQFEADRRKGLGLSDDLRIASKSAIGYLLKGQNEKADSKLEEARQIYESLRGMLADSPYLYSVGGIHVGTEEYVEARLLADYIEGKKLSTLEEIGVNHQDYICGLCDMSGELLRFARKHPDQMKQIQEDLAELYQNCLEMVVTRNGAIRKKLEDLERNNRKMEDMIFQWELRHG